MEKAYRFASIKPACTRATHISFCHSLAVNIFARAFNMLAGHGTLRNILRCSLVSEHGLQQVFESAVLACEETGHPISKCRSICFFGGRT